MKGEMGSILTGDGGFQISPLRPCKASALRTAARKHRDMALERFGGVQLPWEMFWKDFGG